MTARGGPLLRGAAVWAGILVGANVNGAFRELVLRRLLGPDAARAVSTLLLCGLILLIARLSIDWIAPDRAGTAWRIGVVWLVLTLAFEFLAGRYLFGNTWERILSEYDVAAGRIWSLVPIVALVAPRWAWGRSARTSGAAHAAALVLVLGTVSAACADSSRADRGEGPASDSAPTDSVAWTVRLDGAGPVSYGMSVPEAAAAAGDATDAPLPSDECRFVRLNGMPDGLRFMAERGRIVRADVTAGALATAAGARIGMTEEDVQSLYRGALEVRPHKYDSTGRYLVLVPDDADSLRLVFETDGRAVTRYRSGLLPAAEYVEGCG